MDGQIKCARSERDTRTKWSRDGKGRSQILAKKADGFFERSVWSSSRKKRHKFITNHVTCGAAAKKRVNIVLSLSLREMRELISCRDGATILFLVSEPETVGAPSLQGGSLAPVSGESSNHPWWVVFEQSNSNAVGLGAIEVFGRDIMRSYALKFATRYLSFYQQVMDDRLGTRVRRLPGGGAADKRGGVRRTAGAQ